jgi:ParB-like chromosome segregation protein Spo0J
MEIVNIAVDKLVPYENNPRNNTEAIQYVANSIKEFGFKVPLVIDEDNVVICGHTRLLAAKQLGLKDVPCVVADDLTDEQIKAFRLADNKVGEIATCDLDKLRLELDFLDFNMEEFGFIEAMEEPDITDFLEDHESKPKEPKTVVCPDCGHAFTVE